MATVDDDVTHVDLPPALPEPRPLEPLALVQLALEKGADPEKLTKLFDLQERWLQLQAAERYGAALARFQQEMPVVYKRRQADIRGDKGSYSYRFASLDDVMLAAGPVMARCGISVGFSTKHEEGELMIVCRVRVGSVYEDKSFSCPIPDHLRVSQPQQYSAALSFAKRQALCAALNIVCTDIDDDAAGLLEFIDSEESAQLNGLIEEKDIDREAFLRWIQAESVEKIVRRDFPKAMDALKRHRGRDSR